MPIKPYEPDVRIKRELLEKIKFWFQNEMDMDIGDLKAELIFDFIKESAGKEFYNLGIRNCRDFFLKKLEDLEVDMDQLLQ